MQVSNKKNPFKLFENAKQTFMQQARNGGHCDSSLVVAMRAVSELHREIESQQPFHLICFHNFCYDQTNSTLTKVSLTIGQSQNQDNQS